MTDSGFRQLYDTCYPAVYHYVFYQASNKNDVDDIIQNTFIKVAQHRSTFEARSSLKTWVLTIARHELANYYRGARRHTEHTLASHQWTSIPDSASDTANIARQVEQKDELLSIRSAIEQLPDTYRAVAVLRLYHELSHAEIAQVLGWSAVRVRVTYNRVIKQLRNQLARCSLGNEV